MGDRSELGGVLCQYDDRMVSGDSPCKAVGYSDPLSGGAQVVPMGTSQNYSEGGGKLPDHTGAEGVSERVEITDNAFYIQDEDLKLLTQIYERSQSPAEGHFRVEISGSPDAENIFHTEDQNSDNLDHVKCWK